jgi:hypothetical protein
MKERRELSSTQSLQWWHALINRSFHLAACIRNYYSCMIVALLRQRLTHSYATFLFIRVDLPNPEAKTCFAQSAQ